MNTTKNIVDTLKDNYMPYAMSVIVSRAIPQIDGFKPSHRKLLYTMYKLNLIKGNRTKSANVVGQTMKLNPHGDQAIYETMVRLTKGNEALLHPFVDSKGNFGKNYSRDMKYAAARYTEVKLMQICEELFSEIDSDTVDFVDNYDSSTKEPSLLPTKFPNILVNATKGIAVGMASSIPSFNLTEICEYTAAYLENPEVQIMDYIKAPDFPTGGEILFDEKEMEEILKTGRGSFKVRGRYRVDKKNQTIEIYEIPYTTTVEAIIEKIVDHLKAGKIKEITDIRDETDLNGLKIAIEYRKSVNPDTLMAKLFKLTTLQDSFGSNFNILINNRPAVLGVDEIIKNWIDFRRSCVLRKAKFEIEKRTKRLNLLLGLEILLLDIDKAIKIIRNTELEKDVIPGLISHFGLNQEQAEYICEIKLRNLNKEYILKRLEEINKLKQEINQGQKLLAKEKLQNDLIRKELLDISKKYGISRKSQLIHKHEAIEFVEDENADSYPVTLFLTEHSYLKKITDISLRGNSEQKLKDDDKLIETLRVNSVDVVWGITNKVNLYQIKLSEIPDSKASAFGEYLPNVLGFEDGEYIIRLVDAKEKFEHILAIFENGKAAKVAFDSYITKGYRKKVQKVYSEKSQLVDIFPIKLDTAFEVISHNFKSAIINSKELSTVTSRTSQGVQVVKLGKTDKIVECKLFEEIENIKITGSIPKTMKKMTNIAIDSIE